MNCGVAIAEPGMSLLDESGNASGFEPDMCRAIAAAIFGAPNVSFAPTVTLNAFLQAEDVDIVIRGLTRSYRRDVGGTVHFPKTSQFFPDISKRNPSRRYYEKATTSYMPSLVGRSMH
ncbi:MAG: transporter substrate-binding domain-containing protein [Alphaproteobacteria bacterium]